MGKAVGIDLGTTNSAVAIVEAGKPVIIVNAEGDRITPSVVAFTKDNRRLVGTLAKRQSIMNPEATIYSAKRFIGRKYDEVSAEMKIVPYKVARGTNDAVYFDINGE
ncbi:MAG: Hsp70 family protein, partial [Firmicutes bacterium]|nr:Hsp70 family protein [Bacillota bacterium]